MRASWGAVLSAIGLLAAVAACRHPEPPADHPPQASEDRASAEQIWWSPELDLASLSGIEARLSRPFDTPFDAARLDNSGVAQHRQMTSCQSYFQLRSDGFEPVTTVDLAAMKLEGANCRAIKLLAKAKPATRSRLPVPFRIDAASLTALPPILGPSDNPLDAEKRSDATNRGMSWAAYDRDVRISSRRWWSAEVSTSEWTTEIELLAQGDLDGRGPDEVLIRTLSYGREGTWSEVRLRVLASSGGRVLRSVEELAL